VEPIKAPKILKIYQLMRQSGMTFSNAATSSSSGLGSGMFPTLQEAEHNRTLEVLKDTTTGVNKPRWHIFELEVPNPAYEE
jgi:hypothetical protein